MVNRVKSVGNRVLVIFPGALGDLICLLPTIDALARRYGGQSLELMARGELAEFAAGRTPIARAHSIDRREVSLLFSEDPAAPAAAAEFFGPFVSIHTFFGFDNARIREVLPRACRGTVFFHRFRPESSGHISAAYLEEIGESPGCDSPGITAGLRLSDDDIEQARRMASAFGAAPGRFILLMPGSGSLAKNWPAERYLELTVRLSRSTPVLTVLGPAEVDLESIFSNLAVIKSPPLGTLAGLARLSAAFVGNDSGVSHLAASAGARGVVIFGPTDPARWRPLGKVKIIACSALQRLPWQQVAEAVQMMARGTERGC